MFTGLIEHVGRISDIIASPTYTMTISEASEILQDCTIGDSICVNGACLTVTEFDAAKGWFKVGLAPETLNRTNLGGLQVGSQVNLERAMATGARYGGHFVQGHVDFTVTIASIVPDGTSLRYTFTVPPEAAKEHMPALLPKGYVTLDGTSLTLTAVDDAKAQFGIMLIEHSQQKVILTHKKVGDKVNVEIDIVAKGVEKVVSKMLNGEGGALDQIIERAVNKALAARGIQ
ncbi:Lumazine-binding protein [Cystobasidium minutum MCA 4210]|uniref:Lumazine-binding protein n=1 Tax=Cystobasidium minutum MCA 4210 TaxID=1397322 RepID=UPI0034CEDFCD|eukprot:jgi/Rhomi1/2321/CE2320_1165